MTKSLNQQVIEMKGGCWHEFEKDANTGKEIYQHKPVCLKCNESFSSRSYGYCKDYRDMNLCWELFEELPLPKFIREFNMSNVVVKDGIMETSIPERMIECAWSNDGYNRSQRFNSKTAQEAIIKAWLAWKGGEMKYFLATIKRFFSKEKVIWCKRKSCLYWNDFDCDICQSTPDFRCKSYTHR